MCGISAIIGLEGNRADRWRLEAMAHALRHRGPDDLGFYDGGAVGFGFRRLSILDLSAEGHQPMLSHDGRYAIVFNGAIYNYIELREELRARGHHFRSTGDTEVLLAAYAEWGESCLPRLNGMWAFLIHDRTGGTVFGSRDRFGIKPLYLHRAAGAFVLASEIKAFAASGLYRPEINWRSAAKFLHEGFSDEGPETFYAGIESVTPGTCFTIDPDGRMSVRTYWALPAEHAEAPADPPGTFASLFEDAVRLRLRSDVPVGVCLSGGIDSTAIICAMARQRGESTRENPLYAFSFNPPAFDETPYIAATVRQTGATLVSLTLNGRQFWDRFVDFLTAQDEPVHSTSALASYGLMELASEEGVTVVLNGQGADEAAAGYPADFLHHWHGQLRSAGFGAAQREIQSNTAGRGGSPWDAVRSLLRHALLFRLGAIPAYRRGVETRRRRRLANDPWFREDLTGYLSTGWTRRPGNLWEALAESFTRNSLPLYLRVEDRNSMAHSLETRLPFLDHRLVSFLFTLPADQKMRGPWNKFILREAMRGRIPELVRTRPDKFGFPTPVQEWIAGDFYEPIRDILGSQDARERGIYRVDRVLADLDRARNGEAALAQPLLRIAQFELWAGLLQRAAKLAAQVALFATLLPEQVWL